MSTCAYHSDISTVYVQYVLENRYYSYGRTFADNPVNKRRQKSLLWCCSRSFWLRIVRTYRIISVFICSTVLIHIQFSQLARRLSMEPKSHIPGFDIVRCCTPLLAWNHITGFAFGKFVLPILALFLLCEPAPSPDETSNFHHQNAIETRKERQLLKYPGGKCLY